MIMCSPGYSGAESYVREDGRGRADSPEQTLIKQKRRKGGGCRQDCHHENPEKTLAPPTGIYLNFIRKYRYALLRGPGTVLCISNSQGIG